MDQKQTLELWARCEAARAEAKAAGKSEDDAHAAATAVWNAWAQPLLDQRKAMEAAGKWQATEDLDGNLEPQNSITAAWIEEAHTIFSTEFGKHTFETHVDCRGWHFPWTALFRGATFSGHVLFGGVTFSGEAAFDEASFASDVLFDGAEFARAAEFDRVRFNGAVEFDQATFSRHVCFTTATFSDLASFRDATFAASVIFEGATFDSEVSLSGATFLNSVDLGDATFAGDAGFERATFVGDAVFERSTFGGGAWFLEATFSANAGFDEATFKGTAAFGSAQFMKAARFHGTQFSGNTTFSKATFVGDAGFGEAKFSGNAGFHKTVFKSDAWFDKVSIVEDFEFDEAIFNGDALFERITVSGDTAFGKATFHNGARFGGATFSGNAAFERATFHRRARFELARFKGYGTFKDARFERSSSFNAMQGETGFNLAGARFAQVPDFIQANFFQAPRLDNVSVSPRLAGPGRKHQTWATRFLLGLVKRHFDGNRDIPARYRALKRLAIQGHDHEREQMFHAGDITSSRFTTDWPWPYIRRPEWWAVRHEVPVARDDKGKVTRTETKPWRVWANWGLRRLWLPAGLAVGPFTAEGLSSFFRFWFGLAYGLISNFGRSVLRPLAAWALLLALSATVYLGANSEMTRMRAAAIEHGTASGEWAAYAVTTRSAVARGHPCVADNGSGDGSTVLGLPKAVRDATNAPTEALFLALGAGLVLGDIGAPDASTRTYGCLYGLTPTEPNKRAAVPYPSYVAGWIVGQKLASAILLFLFGLAVRNMLKMK